MAPYPSVATLDDFNRGSLGGNWTLLTGSFSINSNQLQNPNAGTSALGIWNPANFGPIQQSGCFFPVKPATGESASVGGRLTGTIATLKGYAVAVTVSAGTDSLYLIRYDNAVSKILATVSQEFANGDGLMLETKENTIYGCYYNSSTGLWSIYATVTDTTYPSAGASGIGLQNATVRADNFFAGTVPPSFFLQTDLMNAQMQTLSGNMQ